MHDVLFPQLRRTALLSASSLVLLAASGAPTLAQNENTSQTPPGAAAPQPPAASPESPPASEPPPQQGVTPAPAQQAAPAVQPQTTGDNVLPETRVVAPVERRRPRTPPPQLVTNQPPAPTQAEVVAKQNQVFDAARQTILAPAGATSY
jgi:hypothetical protein